MFNKDLYFFIFLIKNNLYLLLHVVSHLFLKWLVVLFGMDRGCSVVGCQLFTAVEFWKGSGVASCSLSFTGVNWCAPLGFSARSIQLSKWYPVFTNAFQFLLSSLIKLPYRAVYKCVLDGWVDELNFWVLDSNFRD